MLYIFWFLHQTTTSEIQIQKIQKLYIFWFLHQTTTIVHYGLSKYSCISFDSYIKPQLVKTEGAALKRCISFDSYIKPQLVGYTVNIVQRCISFDSYIKPQRAQIVSMFHAVVYLLIPTSNHNPITFKMEDSPVVYLLIPTSNHN